LAGRQAGRFNDIIAQHFNGWVWSVLYSDPGIDGGILKAQVMPWPQACVTFWIGYSKESERSFYCFSVGTDWGAKWIAVLNRVGPPPEHSCVCSDHFIISLQVGEMKGTASLISLAFPCNTKKSIQNGRFRASFDIYVATSFVPPSRHVWRW